VEVGRARNSAWHRSMHTYGHVHTGHLAHDGGGGGHTLHVHHGAGAQGQGARGTR
jgi:hypothetical protein